MGGGAPTASRVPFLWELPSQLGGKTKEAGAASIRVNQSAKNSPFYPFATLTCLLLFVFCYKHQLSQHAVDDLFFILRFTYDWEPTAAEAAATGCDTMPIHYGFDRHDVPTSGEHFVNRTRKYLPLLEVIECDVPSTERGDEATSKVYNIPLPLILDRLLRSADMMALMEKHAAGKLLRGESMKDANCVDSDHIFAIATREVDDRKDCNMNGLLARRSSLYGLDGVMTNRKEKVYMNDFVMCKVHGEADTQLVCRILELYWCVEGSGVRVTLRLFQAADDVLPVGRRRDMGGVPCVFEERGPSATFVASPHDLVCRCEVFEPNEVLTT